MKNKDAATAGAVERLYQTSQFIPQSVRLLGTRYRPLFLIYARQWLPTGDNGVVADALFFVDFMLTQDRVALLEPERRALRNDARRLRRRFAARRDGNAISARERWKILQWLSF